MKLVCGSYSNKSARKQSNESISLLIDRAAKRYAFKAVVCAGMRVTGAISWSFAPDVSRYNASYSHLYLFERKFNDFVFEFRVLCFCHLEGSFNYCHGRMVKYTKVLSARELGGKVNLSVIIV